MIVYPEFSGRIVSVLVGEGDTVKKGQTLATIDDGGLSDELKLIESQANLAKTVFERQSKLWENQIGSEIQFLEAKTNYEVQKNRLQSIREALNKTKITAPFSGTIDDVMVESGQLVSPPMMPDQNGAFRIVNLDELYVESLVPESFIGKIKTGSTVNVDIPVNQSSFNSTIKHSGSSIDPKSRTFKIEATVPQNNSSIMPNMNAEVNILDYSNEQAILIPESIVSEDSENRKFVFIVKNNTAVKVVIKTGYTQNGFIEVTEGLQLNQVVINEGGRIVKEGQKVKIYN